MCEIVAKRSLARHFNNLKNLKESGRPLYRSLEMRKEVIKEHKATWFRAQGASATIMVPWTQDSSLARRLRKVQEVNKGPKGTQVKVVERPGQMVMTQVRSGTQFTRVSCGRKECPLRTSDLDCHDRCYQKGVVYLSFCKLCEN